VEVARYQRRLPPSTLPFPLRQSACSTSHQRRSRPVASGKRSDRPELAKALAVAKKGKATLVIAKLDRLARNVAFIANLMESKVPFVAVDRPNAKAFELHIYAAMAEEEGRAISARTKAALAAAKARGVKLGNPKNFVGAQAKGLAASKRRAQAFAATVLPSIREIGAEGITTLAGIAAELNRHRIVTERGSDWHAMSVARVLGRAARSSPSVSCSERSRWSPWMTRSCA